MFREIVPRAKNSINGNGMRKALVYDYPMIDVLVRESIQNSLDALRPDSSVLRMQYNTSSFDVDDFERMLGDEEYGLSRRFGIKADLLEIRDTGTYGLDGSVIVSDEVEAGRWTKLVYSFAEKQSEEGKGGSWGYGKTCFYNAGKGFVVFYSRTVVDGQRVSRLTVSLIEDTDDRKWRLVPEAKQGIVYWGSESEYNANESVPLEDESQINDVLGILGLKPFEDDEFGTSIIIPFIDTESLVQNTLEYMYETAPDLNLNFRDYIEIAVQRWYFPILFDSPVDHSLKFYFNGEMLSIDRIQPVFTVLKELYLQTFRNERKTINVKDNIEGSSPVAFLSTIRGEVSNLALPTGLHMSDLLYCKESDGGTAIGMRCRRVGMIVRYDSNSEFMKGVKLESDREFVFAFLRINDKAVVIDRNRDVVVSLDEYVRRGEPPAHDVWRDVDISKIDYGLDPFTPKIIERTLRNARDQLQHEYKKKVEREKGRRLGMSRAVGRMLFPDGFFECGRASTQERKKSSSSGKRATQFETFGGGVTYDENNFVFRLKVFLKKGNSLFSLRMAPSIKGENMDSVEEWKEKTSLPFPYKMTCARILAVDSKIQSPPVDLLNVQSQIGDVIITPRSHSSDGSVDEFLIRKGVEGVELELELTIDRGDSSFPLKIIVTEGENGE